MSFLKKLFGSNFTDPNVIESKDILLVDKVSEKIFDKKKFGQSLSILKNIYSHIPNNYQNSYMKNDVIFIKVWDQHEFMSYIEYTYQQKVNCRWIGNAYPRCCYLIAIILIEKSEY